MYLFANVLYKNKLSYGLPIDITWHPWIKNVAIDQWKHIDNVPLVKERT